MTMGLALLEGLLRKPAASGQVLNDALERYQAAKRIAKWLSSTRSSNKKKQLLQKRMEQPKRKKRRIEQQQPSIIALHHHQLRRRRHFHRLVLRIIHHGNTGYFKP